MSSRPLIFNLLSWRNTFLHLMHKKISLHVCSSLNTLSHLEMHRITEGKWTVNVVSFDYKSYETLSLVHPAHTHRSAWVWWSRRALWWLTCLWSWRTGRPHCWSCASASSPCGCQSDCARTAGADTSWRPPCAYCHPTERRKTYLFENVWINWLVYHHIIRHKGLLTCTVKSTLIDFLSFCLVFRYKYLNILTSKLNWLEKKMT